MKEVALLDWDDRGLAAVVRLQLDVVWVLLGERIDGQEGNAAVAGSAAAESDKELARLGVVLETENLAARHMTPS